MFSLFWLVIFLFLYFFFFFPLKFGSGLVDIEVQLNVFCVPLDHVQIPRDGCLLLIQQEEEG